MKLMNVKAEGRFKQVTELQSTQMQDVEKVSVTVFCLHRASVVCAMCGRWQLCSHHFTATK